MVNLRIFNDVHNALRPKSNKDGCHYLSFEEAAIIMARNPARERNEHGLFLFFDNLSYCCRQYPHSGKQRDTITWALRILTRLLID